MTDLEGRAPSIFLATPCGGGMLTAHFADSVLALQLACLERGVGLKIALAGGDALVPRVRSLLAGSFLEQARHTHLLFVDADIGFKPEQVFRLLDADKDLIGGVYPTKRVDWNRARHAAQNGFKDLQAASLNYVVQFAPSANNSIATKDGIGVATYVGTGFMMVRRRVFERVAAANPQLKARVGDVGLSPREVTMFFDTMIVPETRQYLSEDYAFCHRWRQCGGEVHADFSSQLTHVGPASFTGSVISGSQR